MLYEVTYKRYGKVVNKDVKLINKWNSTPDELKKEILKVAKLKKFIGYKLVLTPVTEIEARNLYDKCVDIFEENSYGCIDRLPNGWGGHASLYEYFYRVATPGGKFYKNAR